MKLNKILNELEKPSNIYSPGEEPNLGSEDNLIKNKFKLTNTEVDPDTGKSTSTVEYLPEFEKIRIKLVEYRKEFQPFKYSNNKDIAILSTKINAALTKVSNAVSALDKMVKLEQKRK